MIGNVYHAPPNPNPNPNLALRNATSSPMLQSATPVPQWEAAATTAAKH